VLELKMIQIKKTKSVEMYYVEDANEIMLTIKGIRDSVDWRDIIIPMRSVFQVQRGLTSAIQKFYRKK
jgi:hypothetical protein